MIGNNSHFVPDVEGDRGIKSHNPVLFGKSFQGRFLTEHKTKAGCHFFAVRTPIQTEGLAPSI